MCGSGSTRGSVRASRSRQSLRTRHDPSDVRSKTTDAASRSCLRSSARSPAERRLMGRVRGVGLEPVSRASSITRSGGRPGGGPNMMSANSSLRAAKAG